MMPALSTLYSILPALFSRTALPTSIVELRSGRARGQPHRLGERIGLRGIDPAHRALEAFILCHDSPLTLDLDPQRPRRARDDRYRGIDVVRVEIGRLQLRDLDQLF